MTETITATETRAYESSVTPDGTVETTEHIEVETEVPAPVIPDVTDDPPVGEHSHGELISQIARLQDALAEFEDRLIQMEEKQKAPDPALAPAPSPATEGTSTTTPVEPLVPVATTAPAAETVISPTPEIQTAEKPAKKHAGFLI